MNTKPLYKLGKLILSQGARKPNVGELGINGANLMYYNDGNTGRDKLPEYQNAVVILPYIDAHETLAHPHHFSPKHLYAIMNQKVQDGDLVKVIVDHRGNPRLDKHGKITLVPANNKSYKRAQVLDLLETFGTVVRQNIEEDIDVEQWLDGHEGYIASAEINDHDESTPKLLKPHL